MSWPIMGNIQELQANSRLMTTPRLSCLWWRERSTLMVGKHVHHSFVFTQSSIFFFSEIMFHHNIFTGKVLIIGGSIANFTNVAATFKVYGMLCCIHNTCRLNVKLFNEHTFVSARGLFALSKTIRCRWRSMRSPFLFVVEALTIRKDSGWWGKLVCSSFFTLHWFIPRFSYVWKHFLFANTFFSDICFGSLCCPQARPLGSPSTSLAQKLTWLPLSAWHWATGQSLTSLLLLPTLPTSSSTPAAAHRYDTYWLYRDK